MMAGDVDSYRHNVFDAEDVNDDGVVSAIDALLVINAMHGDESIDKEMFSDVNGDGRRSALDALMVINRVRRDRMGLDDPDPADEPITLLPMLPSEVRSIDGSGNHIEHPDWGSSGQTLLRAAAAQYGDGIASPGGADRPSPREISNAIAGAAQTAARSERGLSAFLSVWGQFVDHDLGLTESVEDGDAFDIAIPMGDPMFDPGGTGEVVMPFKRSMIQEGTGTSAGNPAQHVNEITAYIDGSQVYGSDIETAHALRSFVGGRLTITAEGLLPMDDAGMVIAGDVRASENLSLTAIHTLFVREHNRLADRIADEDPAATDEQIYQRARAIVIGQIQSITYHEYLPALLGVHSVARYAGYDAQVNPGIVTEFSTAAYRFGHSTLNEDIKFLDNEGRPVRDAVPLKDAFFHSVMLEETGIDSILKYAASTRSLEVDVGVVDGLRNFLFGPPGAGGMDLVAMNIQRGRDHGLSDYNTTRVAFGLDPVESFDAITSDVMLQDELSRLYGDVNDIDLWVGLMAEDHLSDSSVGELTAAIIADQFGRSRDGDRFYFENIFSGDELRFISETTLADVIERNTQLDGLQANVFFMQSEVRGRVTVAMASGLTGKAALDAMSSTVDDRITGVAGFTLELLSVGGAVIDTAVTDQRGNYRFRSFPETGSYQVRLSETGDTQDVVISGGGDRIRGVDFEVMTNF
ncbi:peroxidase family protein [Stieleria varia]|uniref:Peroxidase n=1 Tax=Stieleria varia TaxID=2528005 RepID=A0A5C5ZYT7_9BACT|nr:peroxidase family protein [Stieleria varia]TWT92784.1 peroxidase [Stieleria varia]